MRYVIRLTVFVFSPGGAATNFNPAGRCSDESDCHLNTGWGPQPDRRNLT